jgi:hypothetical protein
MFGVALMGEGGAQQSLQVWQAVNLIHHTFRCSASSRLYQSL